LENITQNYSNIVLDTSITYRDPATKIFGCKHYIRGAKIRAACCGQLFPCRLCHDDAVKDHQINRYEIKEMMCMYCLEVQPIGIKCSKSDCGKDLAVYYCDICKFLDGDSTKSIYHCEHCGLCRLGKPDEFFHCMICNACLALSLKGNHKCIQNSFKSNCPICHEDLFSSRSGAIVLPCGHTMHAKCQREYLMKGNYTCPYCSKCIVDMSQSWTTMDTERQQQPMPTIFADTKCSILCNDCEQKNADTAFHWIGQRCPNCSGYNTRITATNNFPSFDQLQQFEHEMRLAAAAFQERQEENSDHPQEEEEEEEVQESQENQEENSDHPQEEEENDDES